MKKLIFSFWAIVIFIACTNEKTADNDAASASSGTETKASAPAEFADIKYSELGKKAISDLSAGNIEGWMSYFADNAVYSFNNGDSLSGKAAITEYWKKRRTDIIDSLIFSNEIFLPIKVNAPQSIEAPGIWLLSWYQTYAKYKNGKSMTQWIHADMHFDGNDKIDQVIMYLDRASINAASK